jgi:hypothetical protein
MKSMILIAGLAAALATAPVATARIDAPFQDEDLGGLSDEKLMEKLKSASTAERKRIIKELERRGYQIVEQGETGGEGDDPAKDAKETLRTEHFDLKGPDKATLQAKAKELDELGRKFVEIFDTPPARGTIVFHKDSGGVTEKKSGNTTIQVFSRHIRLREKNGYWVLPWPLLGEDAKELPLDPEKALTHEVMHILFIKYVDEKFPELKPKVTGSGYKVGTPLPDWLDEGLAVVAEPEDFRAHRRKELAEILQGTNPTATELIPLDKLLTMNHPVVDGKGGQVSVFYAQSYAFVEYLLREAGAKVFRGLVAGLAGGRTFEELIADEKVTGGKLPKTVKSLEAHFRGTLGAPK